MPPSPAPSPTALPGWLDPAAPAGPGWRPLSVLDSHDLDQTREQIARIYKPHELAVVGARQRVHARMHHRALGPAVSLNRLAHGAAVRIDPGRLDDFFLVQMPLAGEALVWHQDTRHVCQPGQASVISPSEAVRMAWSAPCDQFMLRIDHQRLRHVAAALSGRDLVTLPRLQPLIDLRQGAGAHWWQLMHYLAQLMDPASGQLPAGLHAAMLEDHVLAMLLRAAWSPAIAGGPPRPPATPRLRLLEDHIQAHLDQPLTVADLARAAGSSVRLVQQVFAREHGTTPGAYIRRQRLERVRHDLMHPGPDTQVLQTAARWGFDHPSRFAAAYRQAFGEPPRATLARGQQRG
ncbi:AraC family transcriptional regulator [Hydrogenophaga electricum]|uniref:Transcriptional regulator n=1 Tax=Hydrogenophaga electricum TaxID=1230953 RepID=A0ABQ6BZA7_9BURK|nr:AraC family transcriptional regulator [Hydrogenophaga electricum]GLS12844.1 transcriptional regulator [Hydrogenophaga electricum]